MAKRRGRKKLTVVGPHLGHGKQHGKRMKKHSRRKRA